MASRQNQKEQSGRERYNNKNFEMLSETAGDWRGPERCPEQGRIRYKHGPELNRMQIPSPPKGIRCH